ncbi:phosphoserine aminotransferase [Cylindrobasidium torrendii FP15055 ss-10]|uniref:phosphoserine transaminase n=1 Tax=Cylindrobasidium torrendii FP15055 ss-10 TaxID=1314674 RepID=A0A0D7BEN5_9AGAR|nr:phosphoserine aminotransferase [Cylindrobasidium torrendii FP15055 ss-10]
MSNRPVNFGAGPSALPEEVLAEAAKGLFDFAGTGIGIAEISHRSKEFTACVKQTEELIREQLAVPPTHSILFTQGGGTGQFSAVVLNLVARYKLLHPDVANPDLDYVVTGSWSKKAVEEARRMAPTANVRIAADARTHSAANKFDTLPPADAYAFSADPALIYYCENETVDGVQFSDAEDGEGAFPWAALPKTGLLPLVGDYSSSFMSRPIPHLADHAVILAGAQKNLGPAGLTILIVRQDCLVDVDAAAALGAVPVPVTMAYKTLATSGSLYNTPSVLPLYMTSLVLERSKRLGGVQFYAEQNRRKAEKLYAAIAEGEAKGKLRAKVAKSARSWMNVVFDVLGEGEEAKFVAGAEAKGLKAIKGHRSVGGIRVSLYNAITEEQTDRMVEYIGEYLAQ